MVRDPSSQTYEAFHRRVFALECPEKLKGLVDWLKIDSLVKTPLFLVRGPGFAMGMGVTE
jgi:hypothetical protein